LPSDQPFQIRRPGDAPDFHAFLASARLDVVGGEVVWTEASALVDLFRHQDFATQRLGQRLETSRDIDRIADHRELRMTLVSDGAGDGHPRVNADTEPDRLDQRISQRAVETLDLGRDRGAGADRLPAGDFGPAAHAKQGQQAVAQHLVGLAAGA
jgi:hypothetical protein